MLLVSKQASVQSWKQGGYWSWGNSLLELSTFITNLPLANHCVRFKFGGASV